MHLQEQQSGSCVLQNYCLFIIMSKFVGQIRSESISKTLMFWNKQKRQFLTLLPTRLWTNGKSCEESPFRKVLREYVNTHYAKFYLFINSNSACVRFSFVSPQSSRRQVGCEFFHLSSCFTWFNTNRSPGVDMEIGGSVWVWVLICGNRSPGVAREVGGSVWVWVQICGDFTFP